MKLQKKIKKEKLYIPSTIYCVDLQRFTAIAVSSFFSLIVNYHK